MELEHLKTEYKGLRAKEVVLELDGATLTDQDKERLSTLKNQINELQEVNTSQNGRWSGSTSSNASGSLDFIRSGPVVRSSSNARTAEIELSSVSVDMTSSETSATDTAVKEVSGRVVAPPVAVVGMLLFVFAGVLAAILLTQSDSSSSAATTFSVESLIGVDRQVHPAELSQITTQLSTTLNHPAQHITAEAITSSTTKKRVDPRLFEAQSKSQFQHDIEVNVYELADQRAANDVIARMETPAQVREIIQSAGVTNLTVQSVSTSFAGRACTNSFFNSNGFNVQYPPFSASEETTAACPTGSFGTLTLVCSSDASSVTLSSGQCEACSVIDFSAVESESVVDASCTACTGLSGPTDCDAATCAAGYESYVKATGRCSPVVCVSGSYSSNGFSVQYPPFSYGTQVEVVCPTGSTGTLTLNCSVSSSGSSVTLSSGQCEACSVIDFSSVSTVVDGSCTVCTGMSGPTDCTTATCAEGYESYTGGACPPVECSSGSYSSNGFFVQHARFSYGTQYRVPCPSPGSTGELTLGCLSDGSSVSLASGQCDPCSGIDFSAVTSVVDGSCTTCTGTSGPADCTAAICTQGYVAYFSGACELAHLFQKL